MSSKELPKNGTYWVVTGEGSFLLPLPCLPYELTSSAIFSLGTKGQFLVDATGGVPPQPTKRQVVRGVSAATLLERQGNAVLDLITQVQESAEEKDLNQLAGVGSMLQRNESQPNGGESLEGLRLCIELLEGDAKYISFNTQTGLVYHIEESTNLMDWSLRDTIVATDTNYGFYCFDGGMKFFRVIQQDDRIQFPDWNDFIEQFAYFDVTTSIQGTYHLELYGDGALLYQTTAAVPVSGQFGVYDGGYNPNDWPYSPEYVYNNWELHVSVTPSGGGNAAQTIVKKTQRRRNQWRRGITIQMYNAFTISFLIQDEIDMYMENYFLANYNAAYQVALNGNVLDQFTGRQGLPKLIDAGSWSQLKGLLYDPNFNVTHVSDIHYFGHGGRTGVGNNLNDHANSITLGELQNPYLKTYPMVYAGLDGCNTAVGSKPAMLKALVGFDTKLPRTHFLNKGIVPRFAWGWTESKGVAYLQQGTLKEAHFDFVEDFYTHLIHRNQFDLLDHTYEQAIQFGQHPNGQGVNDQYHTRINNSEGDSIEYVGCYDCTFDLGR